jgi:ubiquinone/menaquinone biosynthesis C-methylase UbiE
LPVQIENILVPGPDNYYFGKFKKRDLMNSQDMFWYEKVYGSIGKNYFDYDYTKGTKQEAEFIAHLLGANLNQKILDVACGPGRHAIALAEKGYNILGIDLSKRFLEIGQKMSNERKLANKWVNADACHIPFNGHFDWAICLCEGAFGILSTDELNFAVLREISTSLKNGGKLLLNVLHASFIFRHPTNDEEFDIKKCMGYWTEKYKTESGEIKSIRASNRYYTIAEINNLLKWVGLQVLDAWGCLAGDFSKKDVELDDFEFLILAEKQGVFKR